MSMLSLSQVIVSIKTLSQIHIMQKFQHLLLDPLQSLGLWCFIINESTYWIFKISFRSFASSCSKELAVQNTNIHENINACLSRAKENTRAVT